MDCLPFLDLIGGYLDNELSSAETIRLSEHLGNCSKCQASLKENARLYHLISELPTAHPPEGWKERLLHLMGHRALPTTSLLHCAECMPLLEPLSDGELSRPEAGVVIAHISTCRTCAVVWRELEYYGELMRRAPRPTPPARLKRTLLAKVRGTERKALPWRPSWLGWRTVQIAMAMGSVALLALTSFRLGQKIPIAERISPSPNLIAIRFEPSASVVHANLSKMGSSQTILIKSPNLVKAQSDVTGPSLKPTAIQAARSYIREQRPSGQPISATPSPKMLIAHRPVSMSVPILTTSGLEITPIAHQTALENTSSNPSSVWVSRFTANSSLSLPLPQLNALRQVTHAEPMEPIFARPSPVRSTTLHRPLPTVRAIEAPRIGVAQRNFDELEASTIPILRQGEKEHSDNWWTVRNDGAPTNTQNLSPIAGMAFDYPSQRFHHPGYYLRHGNFREFFQDHSWENYHARTYRFSILDLGIPF